MSVNSNISLGNFKNFLLNSPIKTYGNSTKLATSLISIKSGLNDNLFERANEFPSFTIFEILFFASTITNDFSSFLI